jgi:hypothetical protein
VFNIKLNSKDFPIFDKKDIKLTQKESINALNNILLTMQNNIVELTPVGATGAMRSSVFTTIKTLKRGVIKGFVWVGKKYAPAVDLGRKAAPVSETGQISLRRWIQKSKKGRAWFNKVKSKKTFFTRRQKYKNLTLDQATYILARSLKRKKRKGQKFFEKGLKNSKKDINRIVKRLGTVLAKGWAK